MFTYDVAVAYRICPLLSQAGQAFGDDKLRLSEVCLKSFKESVSGLRVKLWVLLDDCPRDYGALFGKYFAAEDLVLIDLPKTGNRSTFAKQIDILSAQHDAELVYFAEDDYFYLPGQFWRVVSLIRSNPDVDFVSPYDHLDYYNLAIHNSSRVMTIDSGHHWRTAGSTCLTFLTRHRCLRESMSLLRTYCEGNHDCSMWLGLTKSSVSPLRLLECWLSKKPRNSPGLWANAWRYGWRQILFQPRRTLWVPVPGIATHLDINAMSPGIDWVSLIKSEGRLPEIESHPQTVVSAD